MLKKVLLSIIILTSLSFFFLKFLPNGVIVLSQFAAVGLIFLIILLNSIYDKSKNLNYHYKIEINLLLVSVLISMFGASIFHSQDFLATSIAQKATYFLLVYFALHALKIHPNDIIKIMLAFSILYVAVYLIQFIIYPIRIISSTIMVERGTIRIFLSGGGYAYFIYFFALSRYFVTKNPKYIFLALVMLSIFVLMGSRQLLGSVVFLTFMFVVFTKQVKSKIGIFFIVGLSIFPLYLAFQDVISSMFEVSVMQSQETEQNVRLRAVKFFMIDFFPNKFSYLIGNGAAGNSSEYGRQIQYYMQNFGFYQSDIGMIGEYSMYGILFILAEFTILIKSIFIKLPPSISFVRYIFLGVLMMSFTGGGGFSESETIVNICIMLYLIDAYKTIETTKPSENESKPVHSHTSI